MTRDELHNIRHGVLPLQLQGKAYVHTRAIGKARIPVSVVTRRNLRRDYNDNRKTEALTIRKREYDLCLAGISALASENLLAHRRGQESAS